MKVVSIDRGPASVLLERTMKNIGQEKKET